MSNKHRYKQEILHMIAGDHVTAQQLHAKLKKIYPLIGLGTVYRNLTDLVAEKQLMKTSGLTDHTIYELHKEPHGHIVCKKSKKIYDVTIDMFTLDDVKFPESFVLDEINVSFIGHFGDGPQACTANAKNV